MSYTKLDGGLIHSTVWREPAGTRLTWITMLAMKDRHGEVHASVPGLADAARVTLDECEAALRCFLSPDPYSRTKDHDGRRIEQIPGGWVVLNHELYREKGSDDEKRAQEAARSKRYRERHRALKSVTVERDASRDDRDESRESRHTDTDADALPKKQKKKRASRDEADLVPVRAAHEATCGVGSFDPIEKHFRREWRSHLDHHGADRCALVWANALRVRPANKQLRWYLADVAADFNAYDPDRPDPEAAKYGVSGA